VRHLDARSECNKSICGRRVVGSGSLNHWEELQVEIESVTVNYRIERMASHWRGVRVGPESVCVCDISQFGVLAMSPIKWLLFD
jgi:hypothetical protein